jgi:hypothetical protein
MGTMHAHELHEEDFFAWTRSQAKELRRFARSRPNLPLDLEHIAEEIADLGTSRRDALRSWTRRIIEHLLLLEHARAHEPRRGWSEEVLNFRSEIDDRLSATLRRDLRRQLPRLYDRAAATFRKGSSSTARPVRQPAFPSAAPIRSIKSSATSGPTQRTKVASNHLIAHGHLGRRHDRRLFPVGAEAASALNRPRFDSSGALSALTGPCRRRPCRPSSSGSRPASRPRRTRGRRCPG